ncbi:MAG: hypothetical protein ACM37W_26305 [Actinomycetota bacterium]
MKTFKFKSLLLYAVAISSVFVLFKTVTAYGETNLKAPPAIAGRYRLNSQNLPDCLGKQSPDPSQGLVLTIHQSGMYLSGSLWPLNREGESEITAEEKPSLTGKWQHQTVRLSGPIPHILACNQLPTQGQARTAFIQIVGSVEGDTFQGKISLSPRAEQAVDFTATKEAQVKQSKSPH